MSAEQPWYSRGEGYQGIAISKTGHILVSGQHRRAILCGASKKAVSGRQIPTEYTNALGKKWFEWNIDWAAHMDIRTSADTLLMQGKVWCPDCRRALEEIDGRLPA
jgi:hypothetical protein